MQTAASFMALNLFCHIYFSHRIRHSHCLQCRLYQQEIVSSSIRKMTSHTAKPSKISYLLVRVGRWPAWYLCLLNFERIKSQLPRASSSPASLGKRILVCPG